MNKKSRLVVGAVFAFVGFYASGQFAQAADTYTKETLPEACKKLVEGLKACEAAGGSIGRACSKRVTEREGSKCPISAEEAKRIVG